MPKAIQLHFDDKTENFVRGIWHKIHTQGISSRMIERAFTPHVTLLVADDFDDQKLRERLNSFLKKQSSFNILFSSISTFHNQNGVLFLGVVVTEELLVLHQKLFEEVKSLLQNPNAYYLPKRWVPHCTLLNESTPEKIVEALKLLGDFQLPIKVEINRVAVVKYPECITIDEIPL